MKRFVTYLCEYSQGRKIKNTGFVRVDIRGNTLNLEVCVKNCMHMGESGDVYVLVNKEKLIGIPIGEIALKNGEGMRRFSFDKTSIEDKGYSLSDMVGIAIRLENTAYLACCWKDTWIEEIARGEFLVLQRKEVQAEADEDGECEKLMDVEMSLQTNQIEEIPEGPKQRNSVVYKKIDAAQIRELPSSNWHLSTNSFLKHGMFNYGFLILKKETDAEQENIWLGVPGYFEKPEMFMALLFGFTEFEPVSRAVADLEMNIESEAYTKENQEPKTGIFGAWFVLLNK